ncbi:MAG: hypothetical protein HQM13_08440 [SAR324 cluster bacterium]|nr:hypothetical protein [SAR324 cluster bacterium]
MGLLVLIGSLLIFGNSINPEISSNSLQAELSRYEFRDKVQIKTSTRTLASFSPNGIDGAGLTVKTVHHDYKNWYSTLNLRHYRNPNYHLLFYTTGFDYQTLRPRIPIQLSVGGEVGIGELNIYRFGKYGEVRDTFGWELHSSITSFFVGNDRLWNYFVRPTLRSYHFHFEGKSGIKDEIINGQGFVLAAGLGLRF